MIAVVGPGAVGGLLAALLHRAGTPVVAVARPASAARIAREGLAVRSARYGDLTAAVPATTEVPPGADVILAVKAYGLADVLPGVAAARPREVLALLNGVGHAAAVAALPGRAVSGSVQVEAARSGGAVVHRGEALLVTVPDDAADLALLGALTTAGVDVRTGGTQDEVLWRKLVFLAPVALLTARTGAGLGEALAADPATTDALVAEVAALATAAGVPTEPAALRALLEKIPPTMRSSLSHDVAAGGPTELEALGGDLLRRGRAAGVPTPALARVVAELRATVGAG
ncbi:2-dehydropantoate 2-reductase [Georgenia sp. TF02-10]|uniref:ketopantoate reductase family protein n=1 Tax=Georgenia sp. TF02-10 TaxID=2917725 RepID=UPI001FA6C9AC|nr:2-dehydropantoate 2-reductase [Georgenia sp. TF02-10]UNX54384.1 2-dehydropantoate 2-reductase [Georgenia sp. TF02-10]